MTSIQNIRFWRYENIILILLSLAYGMIFLDRFSITILFPNIASEFNLNHAQLGLTMAIVGLTWGISSIVFSYISDVIKKKKIIIVLCIIIFSLSTFLSGLVTTFAGLLLARAILGIAEGPAVTLIQSTMMAESTNSRKGLNSGILIACAQILQSLSPLILVALAHAVGWRYSLYIITVPGIIIALLLMKYMREPEAMVKSHTKVTWKEAKPVLKNRNIWISIFASIFTVGFLIVGFASFAPLFLMEVGHYTQRQTATIMAVYGLMGCIWNLIVPWVSDRIGRKITVMAASFMGIFLFISIVLFHSNYVLLILSIVIFSAGQATIGLLFFIIPGESVPIVLMATATSIVNFAGEAIGGGIGPALGGALADQYSLYAPILLAGGASLIVLLLTLGYKETAPKKLNNGILNSEE